MRFRYLMPLVDVTFSAFTFSASAIVARLSEDFHPAVAAIENMINDAANGGSGRAGHGEESNDSRFRMQEKVDVTFSASTFSASEV
jgi:hypothetical protein